MIETTRSTTTRRTAPSLDVADLIVELSALELVQRDGREQPTAQAVLTFQPPGSDVSVSGRPFRLIAALDERDAVDLQRYLEIWTGWPTETLHTLAERSEHRLEQWGRRLWSSLDVDASRAPIAAWRAGPRHGWTRQLTLVVDDRRDPGERGQAAAARFLSLPWELVHDGSRPMLLGEQGIRLRRRRTLAATAPHVEPASGPIRILLVSPRPGDMDTIDHRISAWPIVDALGPLAERVELDLLTTPTLDGLRQQLETASRHGAGYQIVHFDGHGGLHTHGGHLVFEHELSHELGRPVAGSELGEILRQHDVSLVVLEACRSASGESRPEASVATQLLANGVTAVVAMTHNVLVEASRRFVETFYGRLLGGSSVAAAVHAGQRALADDRHRGTTFLGDRQLSDWFVPVLYEQTDEARPIVPPAVGWAPRRRGSRALFGLPADAMHPFIGRSTELLTVERTLVDQRHAVVLGRGGEGKTRLVCELARWLVATRRTQCAVFVSLERHRHPDAVSTAIGRHLVEDYVSMAAIDAERAATRLAEQLTARPTLLVIDNCESILPRTSDDAEPLCDDNAREIFERLDAFGRLGATRLVFTSRVALPIDAPSIALGHLDETSAIELVASVLTEEGWRPPDDPDDGRTSSVNDLVRSVGCHARSLVVLAREVADRGVRDVTLDITAMMESLASRHPGDRERSLLASVELSLRRLPPETRSRIGPLAPFHGGGSLLPLTMALGVAPEDVIEVCRQLVAVGLASDLDAGYTSFHPALPRCLALHLDPAELAQATERWSRGMTRLIATLHDARETEPVTALTRYEVPNLVAWLDRLETTLDAAAEDPSGRRAEAAVLLRTVVQLEMLITPLGDAPLFRRIAAVREALGADIGAWHERLMVETMTIRRWIDGGDLPAAVERARDLIQRCESETEADSQHAAYDRAMVHAMLGRALVRSGRSTEALVPLEQAQMAFEALSHTEPAAERMAMVCRLEAGECLLELGQLQAAEEALRDAKQRADSVGEARDRTIAESLLGEVFVAQARTGDPRLAPERLAHALSAQDRAIRQLTQFGEPRATAGAWQRRGDCLVELEQFDQAEHAYQEALIVFSRLGDRHLEVGTLRSLGRLYGVMDRLQDTVLINRRVVALARELNDLESLATAAHNLAEARRQLGQMSEARRAIELAVDCLAQIDDPSMQPWITQAKHAEILQALDEHEGALAARRAAKASYLAFRRVGGVPPFDSGRLCQLIAGDLAIGAHDNARRGLAAIRATSDHPSHSPAFLQALEQVVDGRRLPWLTDLPSMAYDEAVELELLILQMAER